MQRNFWSIFITFVLTTFVVGSFVYVWQNNNMQQETIRWNQVNQNLEKNYQDQLKVANDKVLALENKTEINSNTIVNDLTGFFAKKNQQATSSISIQISDQSNNHVHGTVCFGPRGSADRECGYMYAALVGGTWRNIINGNGVVPCELLRDYNFPESMKAQCTSVGEDYSDYLN